MTDKIAQRPSVPVSTRNEIWDRNGFNLCEIIVIRDGPAPDGKKYLDGRHQIRVAVFECADDAKQACDKHNESLRL